MTGPRVVRSAVAAAALLLGAGSGSTEEDLAALVATYLKPGEQASGAIAARAHLESARPTAAPTPQPDVSVTLLPYSVRLDAELDAVKAGLRDSVDAFTRAVTRLESARVDYERALVAAGGGALVRSGVTDERGEIRVGDVPAGDWILLAWREGGHSTRRFKLRDQDAKRYPQVPSNVTYSTVTYWRSRVAVRPGQTAQVTMSDRNAWMTAARQESGNPLPARRPKSEPALPPQR